MNWLTCDLMPKRPDLLMYIFQTVWLASADRFLRTDIKSENLYLTQKSICSRQIPCDRAHTFFGHTSKTGLGTYGWTGDDFGHRGFLSFCSWIAALDGDQIVNIFTFLYIWPKDRRIERYNTRPFKEAFLSRKSVKLFYEHSNFIESETAVSGHILVSLRWVLTSL